MNTWPEPLFRQRAGHDSPADLFDFAGAMAATTLPERSLRRVMAEGRINFVRPTPRIIRFRRDDLEDFMAGCRVRPAA